MTGIQQMFTELMGYDEYDVQLTLWAYRRRVERAEYFRDYFQQHKPTIRARKAKWTQAERNERKATGICRRCPEKVADKTRIVRGVAVKVVFCETHLEAERLRAARRYEQQKRAA